MIAAQGLAGARPKTPLLALRVMGVGMAAFLIVSSGLALKTPLLLGSWQAPHLLAFIHLALLGWVTILSVGVLYQMLPVIQQVELWGEASGPFVLAGLAVGTAVLAAGFWTFRVPWLVAGGTLVVAALLIFLVTMAGTLQRVTAWNLKGVYVAFALGYLALTVILGLAMALDFRFGFLGPTLGRLLVVHAHLGVIGWLTLLIVGVSYQLVPMFGLAHGYSERPARFVLVLLNIGLLTLAVAVLADTTPLLKALAALPILAGVALYVGDMVRIIRRRMRRRMDISLRYMLASLVYLLAATATGVGLLLRLPVERWAIAYGYLAIGGWVGLVVIGMSHKIVPILVWHVRFGNRLGLEKVPLPNDLLSEQLGLVVLGLWSVGVVGAAAGSVLRLPAVVQVGSVMIALAAWLAVYNLGMTVVARGDDQESGG
ncbi:MAG: hypothetical protein GXP41_07060 [Chloroflexi bacterium]|nr:hypothetical protein [Chloroflexota bacterium]